MAEQRAREKAYDTTLSVTCYFFNTYKEFLEATAQLEDNKGYTSGDYS